MKILTLELGPMKNFVYLIIDEATEECAVVDPGWEPEVILEAVKHHGWNLTMALVTHSHYDHCQATPLLIKEVPKLQVYVHKEEAVRLDQIKDNVVLVEAPIKLGSINIVPLHTPGHQAGHVCYYAKPYVFTGDCLFIDHIGRVDFAESNPEKMYTSLFETLWNLPNETLIMSGHDYGHVKKDTLGKQKVDNPYLRCKSKEEFFKLRGVE